MNVVKKNSHFCSYYSFVHTLSTKIFFSVVSQYYEAQVYDMFVIRGNTAIFKCSVPSFVSDYVYVESWEATNGEKYFTSNNGDHGRYCRFYENFIRMLDE